MTTTDVGPRQIVRWTHLLVAAVAGSGVVLQLVLILVSGDDVNSGDNAAATTIPTRLVRLFCYFTIQSNVIALIVAILLVVRPDRDGTVWRVIRLDGLLGIAVTGLVYAVVLAPLANFTGAAFVATQLLHTVCPALALLAWLVAGPRPRITWMTVLGGFIWPIAWMVYTLVHGALTGWYPYPFINAARLGYPVTFRNIVAILLLGALISSVFRLLDRLPPQHVSSLSP